MNKLYALHLWLKKLSTIQLLLFSLLVIFSFNICVEFIFNPKLNIQTENLREPTLLFIEAVFIAPFIETVIFQFLPIELSNYLQRLFLKKIYPIVGILISALLFGFVHNYSFSYQINSFFMGVFLGYLYHIRKDKEIFGSFSFIWLLHLINNLLASI